MKQTNEKIGTIVQGHFDENHIWVEGYYYSEVDRAFLNSENKGITLNDIDQSIAELKESLRHKSVAEKLEEEMAEDEVHTYDIIGS